MSRPFQLVLGSLLLVLAGAFAAIGLGDPSESTQETALRFGAGPATLGVLILLVGLRAKTRKVDSEFVRMKFWLSHLVGGLAISAGGAFVLYLFYEVTHIAPQVVLVGALIAIPLGLFMAATCWGLACKACEWPLTTRTARFNEAILPAVFGALRRADVAQLISQHSQFSEGPRANVGLHFCTKCRGFIVPTSDKEPWNPIFGEAAKALLQGLEDTKQRDESFT